LKLREWLLWLKFQTGFMPRKDIVRHQKSAQDAFIEELPPGERPRIKQLYTKMESLQHAADIPEFVVTANQLSEAFSEIARRYTKDQLGEKLHEKIAYVGSIDGSGASFRPAGARAYKFFINPFAVFSHYAERHHAFAACVNIISSAVRRSGYSYVHAPNVSQARVLELDQKLRRLNIWELRINILKHFLVYGNAILLPHLNVLGQLLRLELLVMDRVMPIYKASLERLLGWDYWIGNHSVIFRNQDVLHLANHSLKHPDIGMPLTASLATEIESDLAATDFNATVMYKGGMLGLLIALDDPPGGGLAPDLFAKQLQQDLQAGATGVKGAHSIWVSNFIKQVYPLSQIGTFDNSWLNGRKEVKLSLATCFQIKPSRLNAGMKSDGVVEVGKVHDGADDDMQEAKAGYMQIVDGFINKHIIADMLGYPDIQIEMAGRYGRFTASAAQACLNFTKSGPIFTVNDVLRLFVGTPALPPSNPRGRIILDSSARILQGTPYELEVETRAIQGTPSGAEDAPDEFDEIDFDDMPNISDRDIPPDTKG
jgi:Phage portal protein